jgi:hypothetical protein
MSNRKVSDGDSHSRVEQQIAAFESAWQEGSLPNLNDFFTGESLIDATLARELAAVDMEFRWRHADEIEHPDNTNGQPPSSHDYADLFRDENGIHSLPIELVIEEYRIRNVWGDCPSASTFAQEYQGIFRSFVRALQDIDAELLADTEPELELGSLPNATLNWSDYILQELIGRGGFGKVYRAVEKKSGRLFAIKALHKSRQRNRHAVAQFVQESQFLSRLSHPSIVSFEGLGKFPGGGYFLVMQHISGTDLQHRIQSALVPVEEVIAIGLGICKGISHAHHAGIIHGDLKPSNILLPESGGAIVSDFGLACLHQPSPTSSPVGGTMEYLAPEIANGEPATFQTDVFGIGAVLFALLTRQAPPPNTDFFSALNSAHTPSDLGCVVARCLEPDLGQRYLAVAAVQFELSQVLQARCPASAGGL